MTQARLAKKLGIRPQAISAWLRSGESGGDEERTPSVETLLEIADILEVSLDRLMGRSIPQDETLKVVHEHLQSIAEAIGAKLPPNGKTERKTSA